MKPFVGDTKPVALSCKIVQGGDRDVFMRGAEPVTLRWVQGNPLMDSSGHWAMLVLDTTEGGHVCYRI